MPSSIKCFKKLFKHTWHVQQMVVVPSPSSMWDYPFPYACLDQETTTARPIFGTGPDPDPDPDSLPRRIRSPPTSIMDNPNFEDAKSMPPPPPRCHATETELEEVKSALPTSSVATSTPVQPGGIPCGNGACKASLGNRGEPRAESPWHMLKTIFLVAVIVALLLWVLVYALLAQYKIL